MFRDELKDLAVLGGWRRNTCSDVRAVCPTVRQIWLVMHPDVKRSPRVRLLADLLVELVGEAQALLSGTPSVEKEHAGI